MRTQQVVSLTELVADAAAGNQTAWNEIVDRMNNMVWSVVRSFRLNEDDSCDAAQMTWLRALENLHRVHDPERLGLWLATIARRESIRLLERRNRVAPGLSSVELDRLRVPENLEEQGIDRMLAQRVVDALRTLTDDCEKLMRLALCDPPMSYRDIADLLDISIGTVGPRRQRCISSLRAASGL